MTTNSYSAKIVTAALIAAAYTALTLLLAPISFGALQFRVSEALCILPFFLPESVPALFIGCLLANIIGGNGILDVIFGSLATLLAAYCTMKIKIRWIACLPPVLINGIVIGAVLAFTYAPDSFWVAFPIFGMEVFAGEFGVLFLLGLPLMYILPNFAPFKSLSSKLK